MVSFRPPSAGERFGRKLQGRTEASRTFLGRRRRCEMLPHAMSASPPDGREGGDFDDGGDLGDSSGGDESSSLDEKSFFAALNARRTELRSQADEVRGRWVGAKCHSSVKFTLDDWIRRLDCRRWPLAALGSARGSVHVVDLSRGEIIASADAVHAAMGGNPNANTMLFGEFDGGGTLAVAMRGDSVVSAGREGGARAWRLDIEEGSLVDAGLLAGMGSAVVTALRIDEEGRLWVATYDGAFRGTVWRYDLFEETPLSEQKPLKVEFGSGLLSMALSDEIGLVVVGTAAGAVELVSMEDCTAVGTWDVYNGPATHVRSVEIFHAGILDEVESKNTQWCAVCGGGDGTVHMRWLNTEGGQIVQSIPFNEKKNATQLPPHSGMVVSLTGCRGAGAGILVSGAQDGTLRIWDFADDPLGEGEEFSSELDAGAVDDNEVQPLVLYQLVGYKVWLGSVCVDEEGLRLVSDGADNTVVVHDFSD